ncbi:FMN reductase [Microlunatus ginsengisoli]|uniref:FMN reductase n=1 Tax=Microlunatus ginsengisoli TaxID=363863 RepID=A0ABP7AU68_9ACTN
MTASIVVITAGLSQPSSSRLLADRLAQAAGNALGELGENADVTVVELRDHATDLANHFVTGFPAPKLAAVLRQVTEADALIAVSPIFSASYSGLFKMFFDVLEINALNGKPVLIGATGGTARHSLALEYALRPLFSYLHAIVVPTAIFAAPEDWASENVLADRLTRAGDELARLVTNRPSSARGAEAEVVPFERLLQRGRNA